MAGGEEEALLLSARNPAERTSKGLDTLDPLRGHAVEVSAGLEQDLISGYVGRGQWDWSWRRQATERL